MTIMQAEIKVFDENRNELILFKDLYKDGLTIIMDKLYTLMDKNIDRKKIISLISEETVNNIINSIKDKCILFIKSIKLFSINLKLTEKDDYNVNLKLREHKEEVKIEISRGREFILCEEYLDYRPELIFSIFFSFMDFYLNFDNYQKIYKDSCD